MDAAALTAAEVGRSTGVPGVDAALRVDLAISAARSLGEGGVDVADELARGGVGRSNGVVGVDTAFCADLAASTARIFGEDGAVALCGRAIIERTADSRGEARSELKPTAAGELLMLPVVDSPPLAFCVPCVIEQDAIAADLNDVTGLEFGSGA